MTTTAPPIRRSIALSVSWVRDLVPLARQAEEAGFDRVWTTEYQGYDAMIRAALIAASTRRVGIGTGISYAFTRAPLAIAAAAADIQSASGGRFSLGLGMGTNGMRRKWYGLELDRPATRFVEYVKFVSAALRANDGFVFDGEFHHADIPGFTPPDAESAARVQIWGSGVNAAMLRAATAHCDGIALHPLTMAPAYWASTIEPAIGAASRADGKKAELAMWVLTAVADDPEVARDQVRRNLAFYFSTPSYGAAAAGASWESTAREVADQARNGANLSKLATLISDEMVDTLALSGTPRQIRERLPTVEADLVARGVSELVLQMGTRGADRSAAVENCTTLIDCASRAGTDAP